MKLITRGEIIMKKLYKYIVLVIGILAFSACTDENEFLNVVEEEGTDVLLTLNVQTQAHKDVVVSRATDVENKLYDLHFYVFSAIGDGKLTGYHKLSNATSPGPQKITIATKTGPSYIYAVANINNGSTYQLVGDNTRELLNVTDVESSGLKREDFLKIKFKRTPVTGSQVPKPSPDDNIFMMSGYINDGNQVTIKKSEQENGYIDGASTNQPDNLNTIKIYRILAKNKFEIDLDNSTGFTPKSFKLYNIPKQGMLIRNAPYISDANDSYYDYSESIDKGEFTFYCPENKKGNVDGITTWEVREENSYYQTDDNRNQIYTGVKEFTRAPVNSTYVEIQGDYYNSTTTTTNSTTTKTETSGNVSYSIHLGDFSSTGSLGDYNVVRNYYYQYKVIVNGVDDIIAEAVVEGDTDNDDNPYAEGLVIRTTANGHYEVDAHYEARVMKFTKTAIQSLKAANNNAGMGYILNIKTPFGETPQTITVKKITNSSSTAIHICDMKGVTLATLNADGSLNKVDGKTVFGEDDEEDYKWLKFVKNTTSNRINSNDISKYVCKYPGDQWSKAVHNSSTANNKPNQPWLNVFEFLAELYDESTYDQNGNEEVYYTCFIDENYYPTKDWSDYVNKDPRTVQIANNLYISDDKNSIYAEVAYSISQRSIATFYNIDSGYAGVANVKAYGTEIFDEEDRFNNRLVGGTGSNEAVNQYYYNFELQEPHSWNGYSSAVATNIGSANNPKHWYVTENSVNVVNIEKIQPLYKAAAKACMSRNRDLNGNGIIDEGNIGDGSEVRWYLASVGQYHGLFLGKLALPVDSWLISDTEMSNIQTYFEQTGRGDWNYNNYYPWKTLNNDGGSGHHYRGMYHYYTSSAAESAGTYWPEEGITNNPVRYSWTCRAELVRCVRTLENGTSQNVGLGLDNPTKYYERIDNNFYLYGIETRRDAMIDSDEAEALVLPNHNELDTQNELYKRFKVASSDLGNSYLNNKDLDDITGAAADPCSNYSEEKDAIDKGKWRTPNQKELALMLLERQLGANWDLTDHAARTRFSGYQGVVVNNDRNNYKINLVNDLDERGYHWHDRVGYVINGSGNFNLVNNTSNIKIRCVRDVQ